MIYFAGTPVEQLKVERKEMPRPTSCIEQFVNWTEFELHIKHVDQNAMLTVVCSAFSVLPSLSDKMITQKVDYRLPTKFAE